MTVYKSRICKKSRCKRFKWIKDTAISAKDNWIIEPSGYGESRLDGMKLYCKVDFLIPFDGRIVILEWKTGKKNEENHFFLYFQLIYHMRDPFHVQ